MSALASLLVVLPFYAAPAGRDENNGSSRRRPFLSLVSKGETGGLDTSLLAKLEAGDEGALLEIVRVHTEVLTRYARIMTGDNAMADDVVQDVFVALWEQRERLQIRTTVRQYLLGAVRNRALNVMRAERSRARTTSAMRQELETAPTTLSDAQERLAEEDIVHIVERVLLHAPPQCRTVFLLSWRGGLTYAEIARQLGVSLRTVYNQMYRATKMLSEQLARMDRE